MSLVIDFENHNSERCLVCILPESIAKAVTLQMLTRATPLCHFRRIAGSSARSPLQHQPKLFTGEKHMILTVFCSRGCTFPGPNLSVPPADYSVLYCSTHFHMLLSTCVLPRDGRKGLHFLFKFPKRFSRKVTVVCANLKWAVSNAQHD